MIIEFRLLLHKFPIRILPSNSCQQTITRPARHTQMGVGSILNLENRRQFQCGADENYLAFFSFRASVSRDHLRNGDAHFAI